MTHLAKLDVIEFPSMQLVSLRIVKLAMRSLHNFAFMYFAFKRERFVIFMAVSETPL